MELGSGTEPNPTSAYPAFSRKGLSGSTPSEDASLLGSGILSIGEPGDECAIRLPTARFVTRVMSVPIAKTDRSAP